MTRIGVWISAFRNFIIHPNFSEFLQALWDVRTQRVTPFYLRFLLCVLDFLLVWSTTVCPVSSSTLVDTSTGEKSFSIRSPLSRVSLSVDVVFGDEDELGVDVEHWLSCRLESVLEVDEDPEDELDKPGTTMGTKFSVLHCIRIPFQMRCGFWPLIHS